MFILVPTPRNWNKVKMTKQTSRLHRILVKHECRVIFMQSQQNTILQQLSTFKQLVHSKLPCVSNKLHKEIIKLQVSHGQSAQVVSTIQSSPSHSFPSLAGAGLLQSLTRTRTPPPPQDFEQGTSTLQGDQTPSTEMYNTQKDEKLKS